MYGWHLFSADDTETRYSMVPAPDALVAPRTVTMGGEADVTATLLAIDHDLRTVTLSGRAHAILYSGKRRAHGRSLLVLTLPPRTRSDRPDFGHPLDDADGGPGEATPEAPHQFPPGVR